MLKNVEIFTNRVEVSILILSSVNDSFLLIFLLSETMFGKFSVTKWRFIPVPREVTGNLFVSQITMGKFFLRNILFHVSDQEKWK